MLNINFSQEQHIVISYAVTSVHIRIEKIFYTNSEKKSSVYSVSFITSMIKVAFSGTGK